jgi:sugar lactone lactonase YvrE
MKPYVAKTKIDVYDADGNYLDLSILEIDEQSVVLVAHGTPQGFIVDGENNVYTAMELNAIVRHYYPQVNEIGLIACHPANVAARNLDLATWDIEIFGDWSDETMLEIDTYEDKSVRFNFYPVAPEHTI